MFSNKKYKDKNKHQNSRLFQSSPAGTSYCGGFSYTTGGFFGLGSGYYFRESPSTCKLSSCFINEFD